MAVDEAMAANRLTLLATVPDELPVISALAQDALTMREAISWSPDALRLVMMLDRFCWEKPETPRRIRSGLTFRAVKSVKARGLDQLDPALPLVVLSLSFAPQDELAGEITLLLAGSSEPALKLEVEAVDVTLQDIGDSWPVSTRPVHD